MLVDVRIFQTFLSVLAFLWVDGFTGFVSLTYFLYFCMYLVDFDKANSV